MKSLSMVTEIWPGRQISKGGAFQYFSMAMASLLQVLAKVGGSHVTFIIGGACWPWVLQQKLLFVSGHPLLMHKSPTGRKVFFGSWWDGHSMLCLRAGGRTAIGMVFCILRTAQMAEGLVHHLWEAVLTITFAASGKSKATWIFITRSWGVWRVMAVVTHEIWYCS